MARFKYVKNLRGDTQPDGLTLIIGNSQVLSIGETVWLESGYLHPSTAGQKVLGVVTGFEDNNGNPMPAELGGADYDGTFSDNDMPDDTYTAAADNQTDKKIKAHVITDKDALFKNTADGALTQAKVGLKGNVVSSLQMDASDVDSDDGQYQFMVWKPDLGDAATEGLFRIAESQLDPYAQD